MSEEEGLRELLADVLALADELADTIPDERIEAGLQAIVLPPTVKLAGDPRNPQATWTLMPVNTDNGECSQCGKIHDPDMPHDQTKLVYQYYFLAEHGRWPTWVDAMAHCTPEVRQAWTQALREAGVDI